MAVSSTDDKSKQINVNSFRKKILSWYDKHQRVLPWRATKGQTPNPYYVWLSEIMLQQTTVVTVGPYFQKFIERWPTIHDLANAEREDVMHEWAGLGYYARARNLHKCAQTVSVELDGTFPEDEKELQKLPGIGGYTSAAIRAIAFSKPANVVDGNIERIMARLFAIREPLPDSKNYLKELAADLSENREDRTGDYAQALMDLGATICTPKSPKCSLCPVNDFCEAKALQIAEELPVKKAKKAKPQKHGYVYWIENDKSEILFERRNEKEMLGGMLGLPTSDWEKSLKQPFPDGLEPLNQEIRHSFTHFDLTLHILRSTHENTPFVPENDHVWVLSSELGDLGLPTLFSKVVKLMK